MENTTIVEVESFGTITEHIVIDRGNNEFTSMPKAEYDRQQAEQSTSSLTDETSTK
jgi:hypothetical protein